MDDRFLHEGETLLTSQRSSPATCILSAARGILEAVVVGVILSVILLIVSFAQGFSVSAWVYAMLFLIAYAVIFALRLRVWRDATFRITSERILIAEPIHLFHAPTHTVKWTQYQESFIGYRTALDLFFLARPLCIRHGTADARLETCFPSLSYAEDLKHYLDKIDSAIRRGDTASVKPFVAKPRGKRDMEIQNSKSETIRE